MRIGKAIGAATVLSLLCFLPTPSAAYDTQLDAKAIHEAFILGQRNDKSTGDFLASYIAEITEQRGIDVPISRYAAGSLSGLCGEASTCRFSFAASVP